MGGLAGAGSVHERVAVHRDRHKHAGRRRDGRYAGSGVGFGSHTGALNTATFWKSTTGLAHDGNDRIIYETDTGWLNYDSNGSAAGGAVHIAKLAANLALTAAELEEE